MGWTFTYVVFHCWNRPMSFSKLEHLRTSFLNEMFYTGKKAMHSSLEKWLSICCQYVLVKSYRPLKSNILLFWLSYSIYGIQTSYVVSFFPFVISPYEKHSTDLDKTCGLCKNRIFLKAMCTAKIATEW
jgi:hypothetical protein